MDVANGQSPTKLSPIPGAILHRQPASFLKNGPTTALSMIIRVKITGMVIVAVDDLMFSSKISSAAKLLGVEIAFARSPEAIVEAVRAKSPRLVILDLNSQRVRPLEAVAALKADASLARVPTVGFVSHVQADLIADARQAGIDQVLARSAFVTQLPRLLQGGVSIHRPSPAQS